MESFDESKIVFRPAKVYFLEMKQAPDSVLLPFPGFSAELLMKPISISEYRSLYFGVGERWQWLDRMVMADGNLADKLNLSNTDIYRASYSGETAGFAEFVVEDEHVEIQYFGLFPSFIGKGLGKYFLQWVIRQAWSYGKPKIQLNTCELDHPNALPVYRKGGFVEVRNSIEQRRVLMNEHI